MYVVEFEGFNDGVWRPVVDHDEDEAYLGYHDTLGAAVEEAERHKKHFKRVRTRVIQLMITYEQESING